MTVPLMSKSVFVMACCLILVAGCKEMPGYPKPGPEVVRPDEITDFPTLYAQNCVGCHGAKGMEGPSYPLANPEYQAIVNESTLRQIIAEGEPGTHMPPFAASAGGLLTDRQIEALVTGIRAAWYKQGVLAGENPPPYRATLTGDATRGKETYSTYCASCHGAAGQPAGKAGSITNGAFLTLVSDQVLRTITIAGRPDIGQPDWKGDLPGHPMNDQEVTDVVAWLSSQRPGPGTTSDAGAKDRRGQPAQFAETAVRDQDGHSKAAFRAEARPALAFEKLPSLQKSKPGGAE